MLSGKWRPFCLDLNVIHFVWTLAGYANKTAYFQAQQIILNLHMSKPEVCICPIKLNYNIWYRMISFDYDMELYQYWANINIYLLQFIMFTLSFVAGCKQLMFISR